MNTTCGVIVVSPNNKLLACHPTRHGALQWDIVKGCQDEGETYLETVLREFKEETSVDLLTMSGTLVDLSKNVGTFKYSHKKKQLYGFVYFLHEDVDITNFSCNSMVTGYKGLGPFPEIDAFTWISFEESAVLHETQQSMLVHVEDFCNIDLREINPDREIEMAQVLNVTKFNNYG